MINGKSHKQQHTTEMETLRSELSMYRFYVKNPELRAELKAWIREAAEKEAGTLQEYLQQQLLELSREYPMRWSPGFQSGAEGFPDGCEKCPHYAKACPILKDRSKRLTRERKLEEAETEAQQRGVWEEQAVETGCVQIPEWLETFGSGHKQFIQRGHALMERCEDLTLDAEKDMEELPEDLQGVEERGDVLALGGGGE